MVTPVFSLAPLPFADEEHDTRPTVIPDFDFGEFAHKTETAATTASSEMELEFDLKSAVMPIGSVAESHRVREEEYEKRLGSLMRVPTLRLQPAEYRALSLDPTAGFLIANMDGICTVEMILDIAGMGRLEALRILVGLLEEHVIELC